MLRIEMLSLVESQWRSAEYSSFSMDDAAQYYTLHVSGYSGDAGDSVEYTGSFNGLNQNGMKFSMMDQDNDQNPIESCSQTIGNGGWWFKACYECCLNCAGSYFSWWTNPASDVSLQTSRMMIKYV